MRPVHASSADSAYPSGPLQADFAYACAGRHVSKAVSAVSVASDDDDGGAGPRPPPPGRGHAAARGGEGRFGVLADFLTILTAPRGQRLPNRSWGLRCGAVDVLRGAGWYGCY